MDILMGEIVSGVCFSDFVIEKVECVVKGSTLIETKNLFLKTCILCLIQSFRARQDHQLSWRNFRYCQQTTTTVTY